jgi:hypothetical protein
VKTVYQLMKEKARGFLVAYETDLTVHDRNFLRKYRGKFIWMLRDHGTFLWGEGADSKTLVWLEATSQSFSDNRHQYYLGDTEARTLVPISYERAHILMSRWVEDNRRKPRPGS